VQCASNIESDGDNDEQILWSPPDIMQITPVLFSNVYKNVYKLASLSDIYSYSDRHSQNERRPPMKFSP
jgi:hypothetical protein